MYADQKSRSEFLGDFTPGERAGFRPSRMGAIHRVGYKSPAQRAGEIIGAIAGVAITLVAIGLFLAVTGRADASRNAVEDCVNTTATSQGFTGSAAEKWSLFASGCGA